MKCNDGELCKTSKKHTQKYVHDIKVYMCMCLCMCLLVCITSLRRDKTVTRITGIEFLILNF
jgi:hypothetical protein